MIPNRYEFMDPALPRMDSTKQMLPNRYECMDPTLIRVQVFPTLIRVHGPHYEFIKMI